jgi:hypothetical protein
VNVGSSHSSVRILSAATSPAPAAHAVATSGGGACALRSACALRYGCAAMHPQCEGARPDHPDGAEEHYAVGACGGFRAPPLDARCMPGRRHSRGGSGVRWGSRVQRQWGPGTWTQPRDHRAPRRALDRVHACEQLTDEVHQADAVAWFSPQGVKTMGAAAPAGWGSRWADAGLRGYAPDAGGIRRTLVTPEGSGPALMDAPHALDEPA